MKIGRNHVWAPISFFDFNFYINYSFSACPFRRAVVYRFGLHCGVSSASSAAIVAAIASNALSHVSMNAKMGPSPVYASNHTETSSSVYTLHGDF